MVDDEQLSWDVLVTVFILNAVGCILRQVFSTKPDTLLFVKTDSYNLVNINEEQLYIKTCPMSTATHLRSIVF